MTGKLYGGRWRITDGPPLGGGGQADVFRVRDVKGELEGEYALKRVRNPGRHDRFKREIAAVRKLSHPHIVPLIDHSALSGEEGGAAPDKQFLVMPIAEGGDLGRADRVAGLKGALDSILLVAVQLAQALAHAHEAGVIHRDVKPANVLFKDFGADVWLGDFGICLLRDEPRPTVVDERVGPRDFMAPELEDGGRLDVTASADVYSLGKVIYFMLSGGVTLPRERLDDAKYAAVFADQGERHRLLRDLLRRMVAHDPGARPQTMGEVIEALKRIQDWARTARESLLSPDRMAVVGRLQDRGLESRRVVKANQDARAQEAQQRQTVREGVETWLARELRVVRDSMHSPELDVSLREAQDDVKEHELFRSGHGGWGLVGGCALVVVPYSLMDRRFHILELRLCERFEVRIRVLDPNGIKPPPEEPARDREFALIPVYKQAMASDTGNRIGAAFAVTHPGQIGSAADIVGLRPEGFVTNRGRLPAFTHRYLPGHSIIHSFKGSAWPANADLLRETAGLALDVFLRQLEGGNLGPDSPLSIPI